MNYEQLYPIPDDVLQTIFAEDTTFCLTGGSCLHRSYSAKRHSDHLDLFTSENALYRDDLRRALGSLDNPVNILASKLCAVIGRDEPKDVSDICTLMQMEDAGYPDLMRKLIAGFA